MIVGNTLCFTGFFRQRLQENVLSHILANKKVPESHDCSFRGHNGNAILNYFNILFIL